MQLFTKIYAKIRYSMNQVEEISFEGRLAYLNECSIGNLGRLVWQSLNSLCLENTVFNCDH